MTTQFNRALTLFHPDSIAVQKSGVILVLEREKYFFPAKQQSSKLVKLHFSPPAYGLSTLLVSYNRQSNTSDFEALSFRGTKITRVKM